MNFETQNCAPSWLEGCVTRWETLPQNGGVPVKHTADPFHSGQRQQRQVQHPDFVRQIARMESIIGRPSDRSGTKHVKRQSYYQPLDRGSKPGGKEFCSQDRIHADGLSSGRQNVTVIIGEEQP